MFAEACGSLEFCCDACGIVCTDVVEWLFEPDKNDERFLFIADVVLFMMLEEWDFPKVEKIFLLDKELPPLFLDVVRLEPLLFPDL